MIVVYDRVFDHLKAKKLNPFAPDTHKGDVVKNYVVVKETNAGKYSTFSSQIFFYDIMCYAKNYTDNLKQKEKVREAMSELEGLKSTGNEVTAFYDESVKGYMSSIEYRVAKKDL